MTPTEGTTGTAESVVRSYYSALREEEPLGPFFADGDIVKYGISERLVGADAVRSGLREQTERTTDWSVESDALRVTERDCHAWFSDVVQMAWTDTEDRIRYEFDTRWSGTLERRDETGEPTANRDAHWRFVGMHVSTAGDR